VVTLSIEAASSESASALCEALAEFGARVVERESGVLVVRVKLGGASGQIVAVLNAIQEYVTAREGGPTMIELNGRSYLMDAPA
jgi:hypothetical protein